MNSIRSDLFPQSGFNCASHFLGMHMMLQGKPGGLPWPTRRLALVPG